MNLHVYNFGGTDIGKISEFFRYGDSVLININGVGTQTTQVSIILQLHRGHIRGRIQELSKEDPKGKH